MTYVIYNYYYTRFMTYVNYSFCYIFCYIQTYIIFFHHKNHTGLCSFSSASAILKHFAECISPFITHAFPLHYIHYIGKPGRTKLLNFNFALFYFYFDNICCVVYVYEAGHVSYNKDIDQDLI